MWDSRGAGVSENAVWQQGKGEKPSDRQREGKTICLESLWMCSAPARYLSQQTDFVLITPQKAADSRRMEKQRGIPGEMFTHLVVPCCIPLCRSQQGAQDGEAALFDPLCSVQRWARGLGPESASL